MAEINFITAPIGGGKSRFGAQLVCDELERGQRMVVTNLAMWAWEPGDDKHLSVADWCHRHVEGSVDLHRRLRLLGGHEEVMQFYLHYPGFDLGTIVDAGSRGENGAVWKPRVLPDLATRQRMQVSRECPEGCLFVLDEVHLHFGAREWAQAGPGVEHYMSQLRKLNDDIYLVTQHVDKVDKNFRRNATKVFYVKNMNRTKLFGGVSFKDQFRVSEFAGMPEKGDKPIGTKVFKLADRDYHRVYDTMGGVGLPGAGMAPEKKVVRGGHWSRWVAIGCAILLVAYWAPKLTMRAIGAGVGGMLHATVKGVQNSMGTVNPAFVRTNAVARVLGPDVRVVVPVVSALVEKKEVVEDVVPVSSDTWWIGKAVAGGKISVWLSNGEAFKQDDGSLTWVSRDYVIVEGVRYNWRRLDKYPIDEPPGVNFAIGGRVGTLTPGVGGGVLTNRNSGRLIRGGNSAVPP